MKVLEIFRKQMYVKLKQNEMKTHEAIIRGDWIGKDIMLTNLYQIERVKILQWQPISKNNRRGHLCQLGIPSVETATISI